MKFPIDILNAAKMRLEYAYDKFVINGKIDENCDEAIINRLKVKNLKEAIKKLEKDGKKE
jgi:hypothetical protein